MKRKTLRILAAIFFSALLILGGTAPVYADYSNWTNPLDYKTPPAYGSRTYTRTQWMRFYTNYYDVDQPRTGAYAAPIGAYYGDVFDDLSINNLATGYTAIEKSPNYPPSSATAMSGDVSNWLTGYLGLNPQLYDPNYWLCSPAYIQNLTQPVTIGGSSFFVKQSWPLSNDANGSNQKLDVQLSVGESLPDGSKPYVDPHNSVSSPYCFKSGPDVWQAGANNGTSTRYVWSGLASSEAAGGQPPIGDINLTQQAAANAFSNTTGAMTSGYVTASFPYNIMVTGVTKTSDSGNLAYYDWNLVNQTPLWLKGITVRVYTKGQSTNTWNLVDQYNNVDMPPATSDGKIAHGTARDGSYYTSSSRMIVTSSGCWSVAKPAIYTGVPRPNEMYDVIVTADVNLNVSNGSVGTPHPTMDTGMTATYWNGSVPPGLPSGETKELFSTAQGIIGVALPQGYNDNVASASDTVTAPPGGGSNPPPSGGANNLAAKSLTTDAGNTTATFTFASSFTVGGTANVRFYKQDCNYLTRYGGIKYVHIDANGTATASTSQMPDLQVGDVIWASVDADSSNGTTWTSEQFNGDDGKQHDETTYLDNYTAYVIPGTPTPPPVIKPVSGMHTVTYPTLKNVITYTTVQVPIMGWKKVPLTDQQFTGHVRSRLIPPPSGWNESGNKLSSYVSYVMSSFSPRSAEADPLRQWASLVTGVDGSGNPAYMMAYGYYVDVGGGTSNVFIQCDVATGKETGFAYVSGQQVGTANEQVPQVTQVIDASNTHTLYSPLTEFGAFKGDVELDQVNSGYTYTQQMIHVVCPYPTLPDTWKFIVYQITNLVPWPVTMSIGSQSSGGEQYAGTKTLAAGETKYLRLSLNSSIGVGGDVSYDEIIRSSVNYNGDPLAPPAPPATRNYISFPQADDGTGTVSTSADLRGLSFAAGLYYSSMQFWTLQPGFKQVPAWVPDADDAHWGHLRWDTVAGYVWTHAGAITPDYLGNFTNAASVPGMPYINVGSYGAFQTTQPPAGAVAAFQWSDINWTRLGSVNSRPLSQWFNYARSAWPGLVDPTGTLNTYYSMGWFYADSSLSQIILWCRYSDYVDWTMLSPAAASGTDYGVLTSVSCPANGQPKTTISTTNWSIDIQTATPGYVPVNGSYDEILSVTKRSGSITGSTVRQHLFVTNPGATAVTFLLSDALESHFQSESAGGYRYFNTFNVPGASARTIQPGQTAEITSDYVLPQSGYSYAAPLQFMTPQKRPAPDFGVGAVRPIVPDVVNERLYDWTASGIRNGVVGYDQGYYMAGGNRCPVSDAPGFNGGLVVNENAMTAQELSSFLSSQSSGFTSKVYDVINTGQTTWGVRTTIVPINDSIYGYVQHTVLVP